MTILYYVNTSLELCMILTLYKMTIILIFIANLIKSGPRRSRFWTLLSWICFVIKCWTWLYLKTHYTYVWTTLAHLGQPSLCNTIIWIEHPCTSLHLMSQCHTKAHSTLAQLQTILILKDLNFPWTPSKIDWTLTSL